MNVKLNEVSDTYSRSELNVMAQALEVKAPIAVALRPNRENWNQSSLGQTHRPYKNFVDLRNDRKVSIGQARQIVAKFGRLKNA